MMRKLLTPIAFLLLFSLGLHAQEIDSRKYINQIHKDYTEKLQLDASQSKKFKAVLKKHNPILKELLDKKSDKTQINKQIKLMDLEVFNILNKKQFADYKRIKPELESFKKYQF